MSFWCLNDSDVCAVTALLCQCPNLSTFVYGCEWGVSEETEMDMWKTAVTWCKNLEDVQILEGRNIKNAHRSQRLIKNVLKNATINFDISPLKKNNIVTIHRLTTEEKTVLTDRNKLFSNVKTRLLDQTEMFSELKRLIFIVIVIIFIVCLLDYLDAALEKFQLDKLKQHKINIQ